MIFNSQKFTKYNFLDFFVKTDYYNFCNRKKNFDRLLFFLLTRSSPKYLRSVPTRCCTLLSPLWRALWLMFISGTDTWTRPLSRQNCLHLRSLNNLISNVWRPGLSALVRTAVVETCSAGRAGSSGLNTWRSSSWRGGSSADRRSSDISPSALRGTSWRLSTSVELSVETSLWQLGQNLSRVSRSLWRVLVEER